MDVEREIIRAIERGRSAAMLVVMDPETGTHGVIFDDGHAAEIRVDVVAVPVDPEEVADEVADEDEAPEDPEDEASAD